MRYGKAVRAAVQRKSHRNQPLELARRSPVGLNLDPPGGEQVSHRRLKIGLAQAVSRRGGVPAELRTVATMSAAGLALVDVSFVARGRISKIYLADAAAEAALVAGWLLARDRPDPGLPDTSRGDMVPPC